MGAAAIVFGALCSYPLLLWLTSRTFRDDWDFNTELDWVAYHTVAHFHQFPLWNPYQCGGMGMLAILRRASFPRVAAVLAFAIGGVDGEFPIWRCLQRLPMGEMLRFSSRPDIPFTRCIGLIAAFAVDGALRRFGAYGAAIAAAA